jgi:hypothetical protein
VELKRLKTLICSRRPADEGLKSGHQTPGSDISSGGNISPVKPVKDLMCCVKLEFIGLESILFTQEGFFLAKPLNSCEDGVWWLILPENYSAPITKSKLFEFTYNPLSDNCCCALAVGSDRQLVIFNYCRVFYGGQQ